MSTTGTHPQSGSGRIVVGVDGSPHSEEALRWALGQARLSGQPVDAVTSWSIPVAFGEASGGLMGIVWRDEATRRLEKTVANVVDPNYTVVTKIRKAYLPRASVYRDAHAELRQLGQAYLGG